MGGEFDFLRVVSFQIVTGGVLRLLRMVSSKTDHHDVGDALFFHRLK
jgi:hypothetical protein